MSNYVLERAPANDDELYELVKTLWGIAIPRTPVCPGHSTPFDAFAEAFFARHPVTVWKASRGLGGKSRTLAYLGLTEAVVLGAKVNILGGSGAQSVNVHEAMSDAWMHPLSPAWLIENETNYETRLTNGAKVRALLASSRAVRGPHPQRLRMDEVDEMEVTILDAAMGQPMPDKGIDSQTVLSSTHHYADRTFTEMLRRAGERGWPVHEWCWKESSNPVDGWLTQQTVKRIRDSVTKRMWEVEYDLQEPSHEGRAIDTDAVERMFDPQYGSYDKVTSGKEMWVPVGRYQPFEKPERQGEYVTGVDWAKERDFTVITTYRTDVQPWRQVAYARFHRQPWPLMVSILDKTLDAYGGWCAHDGTGIGNVVDDLIGYDRRMVRAEVLVGRHRQDILSDYINAIEHGLLVAPRVESAYSEHKYATWGDIYEPGKAENHLPDSVASGALAWTRRKKVARSAAPVPVGSREASPWKL